jgi:hypothetical protein
MRWRTNASSKRIGRSRLGSNGLRRITQRGRRLTDQERAQAIKQMRAEGRLGPEVK